MKKLLIGLIAALLMSGGLVATATTADAAPYPGSVKTKTSAKALGARPGHARIKVKISSSKGSKDPQGTVVFVFVNKRTGATKRFFYSASDGPVYSFSGLRAGRYVVSIKFKAKEGSKWKDSSDSVSLRVK
ncbi:hypothetical protein [Nocardioides mangrovi]|uniref:Carboxypeptidase regulatory-like domain-containing protein n=1 Tax=Nocardioides mangrovi TaxID=2874580 RepID=A0ABS7UBY1_9ACTN|nr:hypothetical protein [Nocardioides mangrovi]MBZ5738481.1 hypothetical protein [Nocardioides mangrovi]